MYPDGIRSGLKTPSGRRAAAPTVALRGRITLELAVFDPPKSGHITRLWPLLGALSTPGAPNARIRRPTDQRTLEWRSILRIGGL